MPEKAITRIAESRTVRAARAGRKLNKTEAQALTQQIRATAGSLWQLVAVAYDRKAWQALGYETWKAYATEELQMSESRSYQLIDTGRVMKAIGEVTGSTEVLETVNVTARETAKIKPHLGLFQREIKKAMAGGELTAEQAVQHAIESLPGNEKKSRGPRVVEGELAGATVIEQQGGNVQGNSLLEAFEAEQAERAKRAKAAVASPFDSTASGTMIPKGKKVCPSCDGHGYV